MKYNQWVIIRFPDASDDTVMDFVYEYTPQKKVKTFSSDQEARDYANENIGSGKAAIAYLVDPSNLLNIMIQRREKP